MASRFLRNLLGRGEPLPREQEHAIAELDTLVAARPALAGPAAVLREMVSQLHANPVAVTVPMVTDAVAHDRLSRGIPLLRHETLAFDTRATQERFATVCTAVARHQPSRAIRDLSRALFFVADVLLVEVLLGRPDVVAKWADQNGLDAALASMLLRFTWLPLLSAVAEHLDPLRRATSWDRGYCPICGSWPLLGEFRGLEQTRLLRCALCATGWEFPRLRCPFCDNRDHRQLGYLHADGEQERCRAATCDACRGYVKMVATLDTLSLPRLLVADLATLHLDLAAAERGYLLA